MGVRAGTYGAALDGCLARMRYGLLRPAPTRLGGCAAGGATSIQRPLAWACRAASIRHCTRYPSATPGEGEPPLSRASIHRPTTPLPGETRDSRHRFSTRAPHAT